MITLYNLQPTDNTSLGGIRNYWSAISKKKNAFNSIFHENFTIDTQEEYKNRVTPLFAVQGKGFEFHKGLQTHNQLNQLLQSMATLFTEIHINITKNLKTDNASTAISWNPYQIRQTIKKINIDLTNSRGLTKEEINTAIFFNLIDSSQDYFWTEEWQKEYREAQKDIEEGNYEVFKNINDLLDYLHR